MEQLAIVDVICKAAIESLADEVGTLLGQELSCTNVQLELTSKQALFADPDRDKSALSRLEVNGDQQGEGYLLTRIDTAIYLGGTLIMLPEEMISEQTDKGQLDGELADAFGEVANIVAGVFTQAFDERYAKSLRFIKESVEELIPTKVDPAGEQPFPPGRYHVSSCTLKAGDKDLGRLEFIVPARLFELPDEAATAPPAEPAAPAADAPAPEEAAGAAASASPPPAEPAPQRAPFADAKQLVDMVFKATIGQVVEEIGALIGQELSFADLQLQMCSKQEFFAQHWLDKSALTALQVKGDVSGTGYLVQAIGDAITLGGIMIMLPEDQIAEQAGKGEMADEVADAYGEVANILAGGLTQVFGERYPKPLRFIKTDTEVLVPTKLDPADDQPFPTGDYYLASFALAMEGTELKRMQLLFPAELFGLEAQPEAAAPAGQKPAAEGQAAAADGPPVVLLLYEQSESAAPFAEILSAAGFQVKSLSFQEDIKGTYQQHQVVGVFLLMAQVNEKGFATAIKLQSSGRPLPPMIFAGPEWTRSAVLRAVKYGARDILVLPASNAEIEEKVQQHIRQAS